MLRHSTTRKALRISTVEGSWAALHFVLTSGAFFTGYALLLGANDFQLGLLTAIPMILQVFQIPGAYVIEKTGHRRLIVGWFSMVSRTLWLPIALVPLLFRGHEMAGLMILYGVSSLAMNLAGAGWVAWMSALVPPSIRGRYFATRNRITGFVAIIASLGGGAAIDLLHYVHRDYGGYLLLMIAAVIAGLMAFRLILRQPDPGYRPEQMPPLSKYLTQPMRDANYRRIVVFYLYWLFAANLAAPFFNAHLLKHMQWNFRSIALLGVISSLTTIALQNMWGRMIDRYGQKPVLMLTAIGIVQLPFYYAFCPWDLRWPIYLNAVLGGMFWSGFGLASFNQLIDVLPASRRTVYVALLAALNGVTTFLSTTLSGWLADRLVDFHGHVFNLELVNYQILFVITGLLRIPGLLFLNRIREPGARSLSYMMRSLAADANRKSRRGHVQLPVPVKDGGTDFPQPD